MALKTEVLDRIPTYPGRVRLTPVSGSADTYDLVRADQAIQEGTPLNKKLFDQKAYCLTEDVTVYVATTGSDLTGDGTAAAPYATIQKALDSLPKWLDGYHAIVDVAAGTYNERLNIDGFLGGRLTIGVAGRAVTVRGISVWSSSFVRINIPTVSYSASFSGSLIYLGAGSDVAVISSMVLSGANASTIGVGLEQGSTFTVPAGVSITVDSTTYAGVHANTGARANLYRIAGSGNAAAALRADNGGVITYGTRTIEGATTFVTDSGGKIYRGAQNNVPEY